MSQTSISYELNKHICEQSYVDIHVDNKGNDVFSCIPIAKTDRLLMALNFYDFLPDGFIIIAINRIKKIAQKKYYSFFKKVVLQEGAMAISEDAPKINIADWQDAFRSLKKHGLLVMIDSGVKGAINLGRIMSVSSDSITMLPVNPDGFWDSDEWVNPIDNIISVSFSNHYSNMFAKYVTRK
jgi:hypothetical protein